MRIVRKGLTAENAEKVGEMSKVTALTATENSSEVNSMLMINSISFSSLDLL